MTDFSGLSANFAGLYQQLGYEFSKPEILRLALSHRSSGKCNNERLEFLGDSILGFIMSEKLYTQLPTAKEGELSRLRASLVQKSTLAEIARELELGNYLILGSGELKSGGTRRESILADALEAVISAIYQDGGLDCCRQRVLAWFQSRLQNLDKKEARKDAKTRLQEFLQSKQLDLPVYEVVDVSGKDHEQIFAVVCRVQVLKRDIEGSGGSRREAEQQAAKRALSALGVE